MHGRFEIKALNKDFEIERVRQRERNNQGPCSLGLVVKLLPEPVASHLAAWHPRVAAGCGCVAVGALVGFPAALSADPTASAPGRPAIQPQ